MALTICADVITRRIAAFLGVAVLLDFICREPVVIHHHTADIPLAFLPVGIVGVADDQIFGGSGSPVVVPVASLAPSR